MHGIKLLLVPNEDFGRIDVNTVGPLELNFMAMRTVHDLINIMYFDSLCCCQNLSKVITSS